MRFAWLREITLTWKILLSSKPVKRKNAVENSLAFQAQIEDLRLKWCILGKNSKNNSGKKVA